MTRSSGGFGWNIGAGTGTATADAEKQDEEAKKAAEAQRQAEQQAIQAQAESLKAQGVDSLGALNRLYEQFPTTDNDLTKQVHQDIFVTQPPLTEQPNPMITANAWQYTPEEAALRTMQAGGRNMGWWQGAQQREQERRYQAGQELQNISPAFTAAGGLGYTGPKYSDVQKTMGLPTGTEEVAQGKEPPPESDLGRQKRGLPPVSHIEISDVWLRQGDLATEYARLGMSPPTAEQIEADKVQQQMPKDPLERQIINQSRVKVFDYESGRKYNIKTPGEMPTPEDYYRAFRIPIPVPPIQGEKNPGFIIPQETFNTKTPYSLKFPDNHVETTTNLSDFGEMVRYYKDPGNWALDYTRTPQTATFNLEQIAQWERGGLKYNKEPIIWEKASRLSVEELYKGGTITDNQYLEWTRKPPSPTTISRVLKEETEKKPKDAQAAMLANYHAGVINEQQYMRYMDKTATLEEIDEETGGKLSEPRPPVTLQAGEPEVMTFEQALARQNNGLTPPQQHKLTQDVMLLERKRQNPASIIETEQELINRVQEHYTEMEKARTKRLPQGWEFKITPQEIYKSVQQSIQTSDGRWSFSNGTWKDKSGQSYTNEQIKADPELLNSMTESIPNAEGKKLRDYLTSPEKVAEFQAVCVACKGNPIANVVIKKVEPDFSDEGIKAFQNPQPVDQNEALTQTTPDGITHKVDGSQWIGNQQVNAPPKTIQQATYEAIRKRETQTIDITNVIPKAMEILGAWGNTMYKLWQDLLSEQGFVTREKSPTMGIDIPTQKAAEEAGFVKPGEVSAPMTIGLLWSLAIIGDPTNFIGLGAGTKALSMAAKEATPYIVKMLGRNVGDGVIKASLKGAIYEEGKLTSKEINASLRLAKALFEKNPEAAGRWADAVITTPVGSPEIKQALLELSKAQPAVKAVVTPPVESQTAQKAIMGEMPIEYQRQMIAQGQAELDALFPGRIEPNAIIPMRNGYIGTDAEGKVALNVLISQEGGKPVVGNIVAREDIPPMVRGRLLKQLEPVLRDVGIEAPSEGGLSAAGARLAEKYKTGEAVKPTATAVKGTTEGVGGTVPPIKPPIAEAAGEAKPMAEFAGNIRLSKYTEEVQDIIKDTVDANPEMFAEIRRGVVSDSTRDANAKALLDMTGEDSSKLIKKLHVTYNDEEITALRLATEAKGKEVNELGRLVSSGQNDSASILRLALAQKEFAALLRGVSGGAAEAGRGLRSFRREVFDATTANNAQKIEELIKRAGKSKADMERVAEAISLLDPSDPKQVFGFLRNLDKPVFWDYLIEWFYNSILSGPKTHIVNAGSNTLTALLSPVERAVSAAVEIPLAALQGRARERFFGEVAQDVFGLARGLPEGLRSAMYIIRNGATVEQISKWEIRKRAFTGKLGAFIQFPSRVLEAADAFGYSINRIAALRAKAYRVASGEGLKGEPFIARLNELIQNPTKEMLEYANKTAEYRLFRQEPGEVISKLIRVRDAKIWDTQPLRLIVPFLRTPTNLVKYGLERSPLGLLNVPMWKNIARKSPEATDQIARTMIGATTAVAIALYVADGNITGAAPRSVGERDEFYRLGKQPYSIKIGDKWVSYQRVEPFNQMLSQVAAVIQAIEDGEDNSKIDEKVQQVIATIGKNFTSQTYMSAISDLIDGIEDPTGAGERLMQHIATGFIPYSALLRTATQMTDTTIRKPEGIGQAIQAGIPGMAQNVPAKMTTFGEEAQRESPAWLPINITTETSGETNKVLSEAGITPGFVGNSITESGETYKLTDNELNEYRTLAGKLLKEYLDDAVAGGETDTEALQKIVDQSRKEAKSQMLDLLSERDRKPDKIK